MVSWFRNAIIRRVYCLYRQDRRRRFRGGAQLILLQTQTPVIDHGALLNLLGNLCLRHQQAMKSIRREHEMLREADSADESDRERVLERGKEKMIVCANHAISLPQPETTLATPLPLDGPNLRCINDAISRKRQAKISDQVTEQYSVTDWVFFNVRGRGQNASLLLHQSNSRSQNLCDALRC